MMKKMRKAQKKGITLVLACCVLLAMVFSAELKNLFVFASDALSALIGIEAETVNSMVIMRTDDATQTEDYVAFGVYAPSTATYTIGVTAENGKVRVNTGEAMALEGTEVTVSLKEGTNVLYFVDCENPSIQWDSETCDLEPINKVCMPLSGDADQSGSRTVEDLVRVKKETAEIGSGDIERTEIADINGDDSITNEDAGLLRTLLVGNPGNEVAEHCPLIVDAYIEETGILYDTLADAVEAASAISTTNSKLVTVTVLNPTDVKLVRNVEYLENYSKTISIPVTEGAQIEIEDDGTKGNGWCRTITRGSTENFKMFAIGENASLTLTGSSESDVNSSLIFDGGAKPNNGNHVVDVGNTFGADTAVLTMNAGVKITNNENNGAKSSGGALAVKGTFNMCGGVITGNIAKGTGGAINLLSGSVMNMADGTITENETKTETSSGGGINVSGGATLIMEGGKVYDNISPISVGNNSVRVSGETSVLKMGGSAYIDKICIDTASSVTPYIELTSALTTTEPITVFFPQPLNKTGNVVHRDRSCAASDSVFQLSERMLPCILVQDDNNENLCLKSSTEGMEKIKASLVYSNYDFADNTWAVQGVCSDGTYLYVAIEQEETVGVTFNGCKILKVNLETWQVVGFSENVLPTDHSNEMTYNPNTGKIYITHCMSSGEFEETTGFPKEDGPYLISVVDPSGLTLEDVIKLPNTTTYTGTTGIYALAYDNTQKHYVAGCTGFRFGFLADSGAIGNEDYTIKETTMSSTGMAGFLGYTSYTKQGVYANDTTIYTNNWNDKEQMNFITMYDWSGNYNGTKYVVGQNGSAFTQESESMFEYNGNMYMACIPAGHKGVDIYKLDGVGKIVSPIDVKDANGVVVDEGYVNLADAVAKANELGTATIVLKDDVTIGETQTITGNVTITDDGTVKRTVLRGTGCTAEMFNVAGGATLTFTSTTLDDDDPMLVIDGNKTNVSATATTRVVNMGTTNGTLNITKGVVVQNNESRGTGGVILAGANTNGITGGSLATINITGGRFDANEVTYSGSQHVFGGCIYIESGCTLNISNAVFDNTKMTQNQDNGYTYGGVISLRTNANHQNKQADGVEVKITNCKFNNTIVTQKGSGNGGGVLYIGGGTENSVEITGCEFNNNSTQGLGGAVYMSNTVTNAMFVLSGCKFNDNNDVTGQNDIYMVKSTKVNISGNTQAKINCAGTEQIHIADNLGTESEIKVTVPNTATVGTTVATFASEDIMTACKKNRNIVLSEASYALSYDVTNLNATLVDAVAVVEDSGYASLAEAIDVASTMTSGVENPIIITLISDTVAVNSVTKIPTGTFVEITDDGTQRTLQRASGCTTEMFNVAEGAGLTFTSTTLNDKNPMLVIDGNKANVTTSNYAPVVNMNQTDGILNIMPGVIVQNNKSCNTGGVIYAGANKGDSSGGSLATINITGGLFKDNEVVYSSGAHVFGGCIYIESGGTLNISNATFDNTKMTQNYNNGYTYGGVISLRTNANHQNKQADGVEVKITNCKFNNTIVTQKGSGNGGGVLYIGGGTENSVEITGCEFNNNSTQGLGGAVYMSNAVTNTMFVLSGCKFNDNNDATGTNDIYMAASTKVDISGATKTNIACAGTEQIHITENLGTESQIKVTVPNTATAGTTVATFASEDIMTACQMNENLVLTNREYLLNYETTDSEYIATLVDVVAEIENSKYASFADAIDDAITMESDIENPVVITLISDTVAVNSVTTIPTGTFVVITDDGTQKKLQRSSGCTTEMFNVAGGAGLTFTTTTLDDDNPVLVIDGNKANVTTSNYAPVVKMNQTNGILNIMPGVIVQNNKSGNTGGVIYAGANKGDSTGGALATINITGGLFVGNEVEYSSGQHVFGGCIYIESGCTLNISNATFDNTKMAQNYSKGTQTGVTYGGVISVRTNKNHNTTKYGPANVKLENCTFENTSVTQTGSTYGGGVLYIGDGQENVVEIINCEFNDNETEGLGGAIYMVNTKTAFELSGCNFSNNNDATGPNDIYIATSAKQVNISGNTQAKITCAGTAQIHIAENLGTESEIKVTVPNAATAGTTVATFATEAIMSDCQTSGYLTLTNSGYALSYEKSDSKYIAKLIASE